MPTLMSPPPRHGTVRAELRHAAARLLPAALGLYAVLSAVGLLLTHVLAGSALVAADHRVSTWFAGHRTPTLNTLTHVGTMLSDTPTAIVATAVVMAVLRFWLHRWREALIVLTSILGELWIFLGVTATVHRQRPAVPHLDPAPPTSSFPSGHTGAAVALYVGLAVVLVGLARRGQVRSVAGRIAVGVGGMLLCAVPVVVGVCRIYRGMHYLSDVVAGGLAGGLWMAMVLMTLLLRTPATIRPMTGGTPPGRRPARAGTRWATTR